MGAYKRRDSKYWWLCLERKEQKPIRESTKIPVAGASTAQTAENRRLAEELYSRRMAELFRLEMAGLPTDKPRRIKSDKANRWVYLYFIQEGEAIKIGRAINVKNRLRELQGMQYRQLTLLAVVPTHITTEAAVHRRFAHLRLNCREWFRADAELLAFIDQIQTGKHPIYLLNSNSNDGSGRQIHANLSSSEETSTKRSNNYI
jgi:hypothetical protein